MPAFARVALYAAFLAASVALLLELGVRTAIPQLLIREPPELWEPSDAIGWRRRANARVEVHSGGRPVAICTDALGDRIDCDAGGERRCPQRVLAVGDSFVEALAVPFRDTVWSRLERASGACVEVAGVGGYGLSQYVALVRERLRDPSRRYDLVLLAFFAGNDFTRDASRIPSKRMVELARATLGPAPPEEGDAGWLRGAGYTASRWLAAHSHAWVAITRASLPREAEARPLPGDTSKALRRSALRERLIQESTRGVEKIAGEVHRAGSELLVVVVPHREQVMDPHGTRLAARVPRFLGDIDMDSVSERFVPRIEAIPGIRVVDLLPALRERASEASWAPDRHLSSQGHELWFEALRDPVTELLGAPRRADR